MKPTLPQATLKKLEQKLKKSNTKYLKTFPGESIERQPVHTVYGGAQLFKSNTAIRIGEIALQSFRDHAPNPRMFARIFSIDDSLGAIIHSKVEEKLKTEAVEDFRIDFEDGFGIRPDGEEDSTAVTSARELAAGMTENTLPQRIGIRIKSLSEEHKSRALRTLDLFVTTLVKNSNGKLPNGFVVTLPKVTHPDQVAILGEALTALEKQLKMKTGDLKIEIMVETPQTLFGTDGEIILPAMVKASKGRCIAAHFGTYDYTASLNITSDQQAMDHHACDFAKDIMKVSLAGTGIWLSDGATNVMPVGDQSSVHKAWALSYKHITHSLKNGFYQGWDLHPAQLIPRYVALYAFFQMGLAPATKRLSHFMEQAAKATLVGDVFDDAATGQGLLNYFLRALNCGAITEADVFATGLTKEEIQTRSFKKILQGRK